ncbi:Uncharacterized conserved protein, DUF983 family [Hymenobacter daecheongensis DSM 21074]|uniref:Uncharacterized conserved protein, DUF983 family n=1 Tax=Hymenobacter daecheongensis DSM 21074 TaxID=1121955 RepID=A0A1M6C0Y2_9BACT|nr:DUF983 domain-containing protein [Hymenobacter daecheongensis]SHI54647.1 Uncharacterized conserved protein, DUF983 family [Hymenobacter daecheongensis DSM 21074]
MATKTDSAALALLDLRCPRCRRGKLFVTSALSTRFAEMHAHCPICDLALEPEPGFYWGAMFVSYGFSVASFFVGGAAAYYLFNDPPTWVYVLIVTLLVLITTPLVLRYSRAIMLHLFGGIHYNPDAAKTTPAPPRA